MPREFNSDSFYTFLTEGKFMGIQCNQCTQLSVEPRMLCSKCHSKDIEWYEFNGTGYLSTFTCISIVRPVWSNKATVETTRIAAAWLLSQKDLGSAPDYLKSMPQILRQLKVGCH